MIPSSVPSSGFLRKRRILVSGGAGFIGSHLVEHLLREGADVTVLDDLSTGRRDNLPDHERLEFVRGDIADAGLVASCMPGHDAVVHLAAVASVQRSIQDPVGTHQVNSVGTLVLLEAARVAGVEQFVYASSAAVYGNSRHLPIQESFPARPLTPYAIDKFSGEQFLAHYHRQRYLQGVALRFFNVFGPRQDPTSPYSGVISIFADRMRSGRNVTIFGDGTQTRDFIYVGDVVQVLAASLAWRGEEEMPVLNVGRGQQTSLLELLQVMEQVIGHSVECDIEPPRPGDIFRSQADIRRLRARIGTMPATPLEVALQATLGAGGADAPEQDCISGPRQRSGHK